MEAVRSKLIVKRRGTSIIEPTALDTSVAKALYELQSSSNDLAADLRNLQIYGAREVDMTAGRKAIVLVVPVPQLKAWRKVQSRVLRELEKKFSDKQVVLVGFRRVIPKTVAGGKGRPHSRTATAVHEAWLEDMVFPTEIVGKRIRVKTDGSRVVKVLLDPKDQSVLEGKVEGFAAVYHKLTGKNVVFEFPLQAAEEPRK
jgi:small subunit ribosomal protein S7e